MSDKQDNETLGCFSFILVLIAVIGVTFAMTFCSVHDSTSNSIRQSICKQLYQKNTNSYINCCNRNLEESIKLIKDISNE